MKLKNIIVILGALILGINSSFAKEEEKVQNNLDEVVITHNGEKVNFYKDLVKNKVVAINFIYTDCKLICVPMSAVFSGLAKVLLKEEQNNEDYQLISITLDPQNDTPSKLFNFYKKHKGEKNWTLVTGNPDKIKKILKELGGFEKNIESHGAFTLVGNDKTKEWKRISGIRSAQDILKELKELNKKSENKEKSNQELADREYFTDVEVVDQNGKKYKFYSDLLKDSVVAINFGFTSCKGACPVAIKNLKEVNSKIKELKKDKKELENMKIIWVSVDKRDSQEKIKSFSKQFNVNEENFYFISGDSEKMSKLISKFGQKVNNPEAHSNVVFVGNLKTSIWNKAVSLRGPNEIIEAILSVVVE